MKARTLAACLDAITAPTPNTAWLESLDFATLKAGWAVQDAIDAAIERETARRWRARCAMTFGAEA